MMPYIGLVVWPTLMQLYNALLSIHAILNINRTVLVTGKPISVEETNSYSGHLASVKLAGWTIFGLFISIPFVFVFIEVMRVVDGR